MHWMLGRVQAEGTERQLVFPNGASEMLQPAVLAGPGDLLLAAWSGTQWTDIIGPVAQAKWPREVQELPEPGTSRTRVQGSEIAVVAKGMWLYDPQGRPCELARVRVGSEQWLLLLNYCGWRLSDLNIDRMEIERQGGVLFLKSRSDLFSLPLSTEAQRDERQRRDLDPSFVQRTSRPWQRSRLPEPEQAAVPLQPSPAEHVPAPRIFRVDQVVWLDESIEIPDGPLSGHAPFPRARAGIEPLKDALSGLLKRRSHLKVTSAPDGSKTVECLVDLEAHIIPAKRRKFVDEHMSSDDWTSAEEVCRSYYGPEKDDPVAVVEIAEFTLGKREAAFRRLFQNRPDGLQPLIWKGRAMLCPIQTPTGQVGWVWEVPREDHASYIFVTDEVDRLKRSLGDPDVKRQSVRTTQGPALGYVGKVIHRGDLDRWWQGVIDRVQKAPR